MSLRGCALLALTVACALAAAWPPAGAWAARGRDATAPHGRQWDATADAPYSATLEQCIPSADPIQRSVTFIGQMTAVPGTQRMGMRIELQERAPGDTDFHTVTAPSLGVWRGSEAGVKIYRYVKQITNLSAPTVYRAVVRFRWIGERGHTLKRAVLRTAHCDQLLVPAPSSKANAQPAAG